MTNWDDEEEDFVAKELKNAWDDDEDAAVPDAWDAEPAPVEVKTTAVSNKPKLSLSERIRIKEEQKRKEREEKSRKDEELRSDQNLSEMQREKLSEEAEIGLLHDVFGSKAESNDEETINSFCPKTKEDFNRLYDMLVKKFSTIDKSPHFSGLAESLIRYMTLELDVELLKSLNTNINALIIEKQKLNKGKNKKKSKTKLMIERDNDYIVDQDHAIDDDYDDFM